MQGWDPVEEWTTKQQLDACLKSKGIRDISLDQLERWRGAGVLPRVHQETLNYGGSITYYPPGTCQQIAAIHELLSEKHRLEYVGWELWWRGFPVDEKHWKPSLQKIAERGDRLLKILNWQIAGDEKYDRNKTTADRVVQSNEDDIILSRLRGRLKAESLASVFGTLIETATGRFNGFTPPTGTENRSEHESDSIKALDLDQSEKHKVLGQKLGLVTRLTPTLRQISKALRSGALIEGLRSDTEIAGARDDIRNALRIALAFHEASAWIYGQQSFGLRLGAWIARKSNRLTRGAFILVWIKLRHVSNDLLSSSEIRLMADEAENIRALSEQLKTLQQNDKRFSEVLNPKTVREALRDKSSFERFLKEIQRARLPKP